MVDFIARKEVVNEEELLTAFNPEVQNLAEKFDFRTQFESPTVDLEELSSKVELLAKSMIALGLTPGNKVGVYDASLSEWSVLYGASQNLGIELVHVGREFSSEDTIQWLTKNQCRVLFASKNAQLYLKDLIAAFDANQIKFFPVEFIVMLDEQSSLKEEKVISINEFEYLAQFSSDRELEKVIAMKKVA